MADFPTSKKTWADLVDGVSPANSSDINSAYAEITAIEDAFLTDSTSLNASTDIHGFLPKLSGTITEYYAGDGNWRTVLSSVDEATIATAGKIFLSATSDVLSGTSDQKRAITAETFKAAILIDSTDLNVSTSAHGFMPKLSGTSDQYINGLGEWATVTGGTAASSDLIEHTHTGSTDGGLIRLDTITAPTDSTSLDASISLHGLLPKLDGSTSKYLDGTGAWVSLPSATSAAAGIIYVSATSDVLSGTSDQTRAITAETFKAAVLVDSTDLDADVSHHGFMPKLNNTSDNYFNGKGEWAAVVASLTEHTHTTSDTGGLIRLDTISAPTDSTSLDASTDMHGLLPKLNGNNGTYLNGTGNFGSLLYATYTANGAVTIAYTSDVIAGTTDSESNTRTISVDNLIGLFRSATTDFDASTDTHGFLPMLSGTSDNFLNGKGEYAAIQTATTDTAGIKMLASSSDIDAGTTDNLMVGTNLFTKSNYGIRFVYAPLNGSTALAAGDKAYFPIPTEMSGWNLVQARATCGANTSSDATVFTVKKGGGTKTLLSTNITIDPTLTDSLASSDQPVISSSDNPVTSTDIIEVAATSDCGAGMTYAGVLTGWQLP